MNPRHALVVSLDPGIQWESPKGAAFHLREDVRGLREDGWQVTLLTREGIGPVTESGWDCRAVPGTGHRKERARGAREEGFVADNPALARAALAVHAALPASLIYERFALWSDVGVRLSRATETPLVLEVNAPLLAEQARYRQLERRELAADLERETLSAAARVLVVSRPLARMFEAKGVPAERLQVLPNIADPRRFTRSGYELPAAADPLVLGFWGSLKPWHGLDWFLPVFARAAKRHPRLVLEVFGTGPQEKELRELTAGLGAQGAVTFHGHIPFEELPARLAKVHLAVAPYPPLDEFYFSPLKIAEALAAGIPTLAAAVGDLPAMLGHGRGGWLLPPGDNAAWQQKLEAVAEDPQPLAALAAGARELSSAWSPAAHMRSALAGLTPGGDRAAV